MRALIAAAFCLVAPCLVAAPALAQPAQTPPCQSDVHDDFDFWLGEWEVFTPDGKKAGENVITEEEAGCLLVERWTAANGSTGQSYNFYDNAAEKWRQVWVSPGVTIDYTGGLNEAGEMILTGTIAYANGLKAPFRGAWTPLENGEVRQRFEQYDKDKDEWGEWFVGIYKRKPGRD